MRTIMAISVLLFLAMARESTQQPPSQGGTPPGRNAIAMPADTIKWVQVRPGQETSALWGDRLVGPYGSFNKFAAGFEDRPHYHTRDLHSVIVSGTVIVQSSGAPSRELGPGSYGFLPGGTVHTHSCKAGTPCVIFVQQDGPGDSVPAESVR
jgi:ChrR Cupin-like domain